MARGKLMFNLATQVEETRDMREAAALMKDGWYMIAAAEGRDGSWLFSLARTSEERLRSLYSSNGRTGSGSR